jgi:hypothetical protein
MSRTVIPVTAAASESAYIWDGETAWVARYEGAEMRRFIMEVATVVLLGTMLVFGLAVWSMATSTPRETLDTNNVAWLCYDERLKSAITGSTQGYTQLCYAETGIKAVIDAEDLAPGELYTAWLAYIDSPGACSATPCPLPEMMRLTPPPPILRFDGAVADDTKRTRLASVFRGLTPLPGAQIQVLLVGHGRAIPGEGRPAQILSTTWPGVIHDGATGVGLIARAHFVVQSGWN